MAKFGGNEFTHFSVPLAFEGRYFVLEPGNPPLMTVVVDNNGSPAFEVLKNKPGESPLANSTTNPTGVVTVSDKTSGKFLYKVRPGSETSVTFGTLNNNEIEVRITDKSIKVGTNTIANNTFVGAMAGVVIQANGSFGIGAQIPENVRKWLAGQ